MLCYSAVRIISFIFKFISVAVSVQTLFNRSSFITVPCYYFSFYVKGEVVTGHRITV
jgi:hypothetical protein